MEIKKLNKQTPEDSKRLKELFGYDLVASPSQTTGTSKKVQEEPDIIKPEILVISSYPPRECGIATYSRDLITALNKEFDQSFDIRVCALETGDESFEYPDEVKFRLDTSQSATFFPMALSINQDKNIEIVVLQHEFGFFHKQEEAFLQFLHQLTKPLICAFHTVLPRPDSVLRTKVQQIASACKSIIVMTHNSEEILIRDYEIPKDKISVIAHGTHLAGHVNITALKEKKGFTDRKILSTFGLLSSGKSIETTLDALPAIIKSNPEVIFLVIGATHPEVVKKEGEAYRRMLETKVIHNGLTDHVKFINRYLELPELLDYLQLTDIYIFSSHDPNQAVSGTFAYAMSCGCPIISTPIPHAKELLTENTGIIFDFGNSSQLAEAVTMLLNDEQRRKHMVVNTLQKITSTAWENSAIGHAMIFHQLSDAKIHLKYNLPEVRLDHLFRMTTDFGMIQFSKISQPDIDSGYTLDDNARALMTLCMHYEVFPNEKDLIYMQRYLEFIDWCQQPEGNFLNYVDADKNFTEQNNSVNLDDSNGRAIWALGYLISKKSILPTEMIYFARMVMERAIPTLPKIYSTRAMAFAIKGLYYYQHEHSKSPVVYILKTMADRLVQMYRHVSEKDWEWYESYLTYANSILPEAMMCAWLVTADEQYKEVARESFDFLLSHIYTENGIEVISNRKWFIKGEEKDPYGEQPIDVAYTILALSKFYDVYKDPEYSRKLILAFDWFLGHNRLHRIMYNPRTTGCFDGLEENNINLNQGAESLLSYLMARMTVEKHLTAKPRLKQKEEHLKKFTKLGVKGS
ncbi:MAG TPA: glycosyltransferase [Prolixibacteraceae bacterium]|nr:glycosyltransferase [Prolixibacteraceae bacterium]